MQWIFGAPGLSCLVRMKPRIRRRCFLVDFLRHTTNTSAPEIGDPHLGAGYAVAAFHCFSSRWPSTRSEPGSVREARNSRSIRPRQFRQVFLSLNIGAERVVGTMNSELCTPWWSGSPSRCARLRADQAVADVVESRHAVLAGIVGPGAQRAHSRTLESDLLGRKASAARASFLAVGGGRPATMRALRQLLVEQEGCSRRNAPALGFQRSVIIAPLHDDGESLPTPMPGTLRVFPPVCCRSRATVRARARPERRGVADAWPAVGVHAVS